MIRTGGALILSLSSSLARSLPLKDLLIMLAKEDVQTGIVWFSILVFRVRVRVGLVCLAYDFSSDEEVVWACWISSQAAAAAVELVRWRREGEMSRKRSLVPP